MDRRDADGIGIRFEALSSRPGIRIVDPIENAQYVLYTSSPVSLATAAATGFPYPVDEAVAFETDVIETPMLHSVFVHDRTQERSEFHYGMDSMTVSEPDALEFGGPPMKLYLLIDGTASISSDGTAVRIELDEPQAVRLGARSFHEQPATTISTPPAAEDVMEALSYLGTALKTDGCERSYPTLRGHPPLFELDEELRVPAGLDRPETGVTLELPTTFEAVYPAAPLAYYLGANVIPSPDGRRRLVVGDREYPLDRGEDYERSIHRVLKQVLFLDCITRTEGYYAVDLHERSVVEPLVDLDFADLYDRPVDEQVNAYLSVPASVLEPHLPEWPLTVDVQPDARFRDVLPFVAYELAFVRCPDTTQSVDVRRSTVIDDFLRSPLDRTETKESFIVPPEADTTAHAWVGDGYPLDANKTSSAAYRRRLDFSPSEAHFDVHVVCNDPAMAEESVVNEYYGLRDILEFEVTIHQDVTTDELHDLLETSIDFLHYVGHVDRDGILCVDGSLDVRTMDRVGVKAFLLNACRSFEQGQALVDNGSYAGVATLKEIENSVATKIGQSFARLLNGGFTLRIANKLAQVGTLGYEYIVIGDGGLNLCQTKSGTSLHVRVEPDGENYRVELVGHVTPGYRIGSTFRPHLPGTEGHYLSLGTIAAVTLDEEELTSFLGLELLPIVANGDLYWSDEFSVDCL